MKDNKQKTNKLKNTLPRHLQQSNLKISTNGKGETIKKELNSEHVSDQVNKKTNN